MLYRFTRVLRSKMASISAQITLSLSFGVQGFFLKEEGKLEFMCDEFTYTRGMGSDQD